MTAEELRTYLNLEYGNKAWPSRLRVSPDTYANCCQEVFNWLWSNSSDVIDYGFRGRSFRIRVGKNKGLMFKDVELILDPEVKD